MLSRIIQKHWYDPNFLLTLILFPVSMIFCSMVYLRRLCYRLGILSRVSLPVPVVVVGNISVGGTGKTPLVIAIVNRLAGSGYKPGIICRGYGGKSQQWPQWVTAESNPEMVGDEAVLMARHCNCPVASGPDRVAAGRRLLAESDCDVIVSDDGLQHYALSRTVEIVVVDGERLFGNGHCLPAGPLRERQSRIKEVDFVVINGETSAEDLQGAYRMSFQLDGIYNFSSPTQTADMTYFKDRKIHAVSGIGNNNRFFNSLEKMGMKINRHPFPDHHRYQQQDVDFNHGADVIMTEKDAVKCVSFADKRFWFVRVSADVEQTFFNELIAKLRTQNG